MRRYIRTLRAVAETATYAGVAKTDKIDLPRDYVLQRIIMDTRGTMTVTTNPAVLVEDAGQRLMQKIELEMTGGRTGNKTVVSVSGVDLYFVNFYDNSEGLERVTPTAVAAGGAVSFVLVLDFRLAKKDSDDWSVGIPTYEKSSITLSITWDTPTNGYGTNTGTWDLTTKLTLIEGIPEDGKEFEAAKGNPLLTLTASTQDADSSSGSEEDRNTDISVGHLLRRLWFYARTNAGARSDTEIDYISLSKIDLPIFQKYDWDAIQTEDELDYNLSNYDGNQAIKGLICLDFARGAVDERGRVLGEDLRNLKSGDMKFTLYKNNASSKLRYLREAVEAV